MRFVASRCTMPELAYLNGEILPIEKAFVPIEERGFQFGDAVYEVIASYEGRLFALEEHLDRLERSMGELFFPDMDRDLIKRAILEVFTQAQIPRAAVYLQITRGSAPRDHRFPENPTPNFMMTVKEIHDVPLEYLEKGVAVMTTTDLRWGRCDIKTVQLLANSMAKQKALENGFYDAIFLSPEKIVREATSSNLFMVKGGELWTHPLTDNILPGITRKVILELAAEMKTKVREEFFSLDDLFGGDEVFLSGTITEVLPIVRVDNRKILDAKVGPVTKDFSKAIKNRMLATLRI